jgi:type I restriction enzyme S subunit
MAGEGWIKIRVADLVSQGALAVNDGYRVRNVELGSTGIPFVRGGDIGDGSVSTSVSDHILPEFHDRVANKLAQPGDVVFISKGTVGRVGYLRPGQPQVVFAPQVCYWRALDRGVLNPRFVFNLLRSHEFQSNLQAVMTHGSMVADYVSLSDQRNFTLTVPPIEAQNAIAHILGTLDDKIELNRRMDGTLEAMARALFKSWFVDFDPVRAKLEGRQPAGMDKATAALFPDSFQDSPLGKIPKGWRRAVLDDVTDAVLGGDWGKDAAEGDFTEPSLCVRGADIPSLQAGGTGEMPVRHLKLSSLVKRSLNDGDIVFEISGGSPTQSTGRPVLVTRPLLERLPHPLVCSNFCRMIRLRDPSTSVFAYYWLRWLYDNDEFLQYENGTTGIKNLAFTVFSSAREIVLPSPAVLVAFQCAITSVLERRGRNGVECETLAALRDALLPKLLSGEIRVKDAERIIQEST